jgi:threonine/homoserine/homoserine lactone efflux protein
MEKTTVYELLGFLLAFLGMGIGYYAVHFGIRLERTKRELEHKERMRALELGRSLPGDGSWLSPLRAGVLVAAAVPIGVIGFASLSSLSMGYQEGTWQVAGVVSCFAVVCGTVLTSLASTRQSQDPLESAARIDKEHVEDDAYDVVSARG